PAVTCVALCCSFPPSAARRDHPSFPTRRSSDLERAGRLGNRHVRVPVVREIHLHPFDAEPAQARLELPLDPGGRETVIFAFVHRDRKSTRLNSSHQIISYAVFCLKKKNSASRRI